MHFLRKIPTCRPECTAFIILPCERICKRVNNLTENKAVPFNNELKILWRNKKECFMLAIDRMPLYKNKPLMSSLAVVAGFVLTVGIIHAVSPGDTSSHQSALPTYDRPAASLIPVKASSSETASESGSVKTGSDSTDATGSMGSYQAGSMTASSTQLQGGSSGTTSTQSTAQPQSPQPATSSGTQQTQSSPTPTGGSTTPASTSQPAPASSCLLSTTIAGLCL